MTKFKYYRFLLFGIILLCLILIIIQNRNLITTFAVTNSVNSNVSVLKSLAISFSQNLSQGVQFGEIAVLPALNINASHNYDGINDSSTFYVQISKDGNTNVNLCIKADGNLVSPNLDEIGLANETYSYFNVSNSTLPSLNNETSLQINYTPSLKDITPGSVSYYRFWLDIPASQPSGNYNNTIAVKGIQVGGIC